MSTELPRVDVAVVGGGVIGLAAAWRARQRGLEVAVLERAASLGTGASRAAAGMLAPVAEADLQERDLLHANLESARRWPAFAAELADVTGIDVGYRECGTLLVARDRDEAEHVEREREVRERLGLRVERMLGSAARRVEPALAPSLRLAVALPDDHAVEPLRVVAALAEACSRAGVRAMTGVEVRDAAALAALPAERVVVAAGAWSGALGAPGGATVPVRPVKGQSLRLRDPSGPGLCDHVLRFEGGYLVPRGDGRYYLGATVEERGFDEAITALGVYELLREASEVLPGILELEIEEALAGFRPGTPDNAPVIGVDPRDERIVWATGHYRNGILLCPVTADLVAAALAGEAVEGHAGLRPERFTKEPATP